ncbi:MAG: hypothetical protein SCK28_05715 [Bacillota bacterium]|nr:hypothetical protein [Bacillota bacterium]
MPIHFLHPILTAIFALLLVILVPRSEIRRLAIYGIIFGGLMDVLMLTIGNLTGFFGWINFGPFGLSYLPFFAPISWSIYYIMYFYFLPRQKTLIYLFAASGIGMSILYTNVVINLGVFMSTVGRVIVPLITFIFWFSIATMGYFKLSEHFGNIKKDECNKDNM